MTTVSASASNPRTPLSADAAARDARIRQLHDVQRGRVRMSASRFMKLVRAVNAM